MCAIAAFAMISCNNDEENTTSLPYVDNTPVFELDRYIEASSTHTMEAADVTNATGVEVTYSWSVTRGSTTVDDEDLDKDGQTFTFTFWGSEKQDTLCNFTVTCSTSATGYYGMSHSVTTTTVNENSLSREGDSDIADGIITGTCSDGNSSYNTVTIGGLEWMAENIASEGTGEEAKGAALENSDAVSRMFGRFYTWDEATEICSSIDPDGGNAWRLPSRDDWNSLGRYFSESGENGSGDGTSSGENGNPSLWAGATGKLMTNVRFNGDEMWEYWPAVQITNESGFSVIPTGYATVLDRGEGQNKIWTFFGMNEYAGFWTSTEYQQENGSGNAEDAISGASGGNAASASTQSSSSAYYVYMYDNRPDLLLNYTDKSSFALPVRCVRDAR